MTCRSLCVPTSYVCTTFAWFSCAATRASSKNIDKVGSTASSGRSALSTTSLLNPPWPRCTARYTFAMPPCPNSARMRHLPTVRTMVRLDSPSEPELVCGCDSDIQREALTITLFSASGADPLLERLAPLLTLRTRDQQ